MEVAIFVKSIAYYHSSQSVYIQGKVSEIRKLSDKQYEPNFLTVKKGSHVSFKLDTKKVEEVSNLLPHEILAIKSTELEDSKNRNKDTTPPFIVAQVVPLKLLEQVSCAQFTEN